MSKVQNHIFQSIYRPLRVKRNDIISLKIMTAYWQDLKKQSAKI